MTKASKKEGLEKLFRFFHEVSGKAIEGSLDINRFVSLGKVLLGKGEQTVNLFEFVAKGFPSVDYTKPVPKAVFSKSKHNIIKIDLGDNPPVFPGSKIVEHNRGRRCNFYPVRVGLHFDPGQLGGKSVRGSVLQEKSRNQRVMNANMLEWYLANTDYIPEKWKGSYVCFRGTLYCDDTGNYYVRSLYWDLHDNCWGIFRCFIIADCGSGFPAAVHER